MKTQLLEKFLRKKNSNRDIYHNLMQFKVKEILLVSTLYDAYILENEDRFFEQSMGEVYHLNLSSLPSITGTSSPEDTLELLENRGFDLVILMMGINNTIHIELSKKIKEKYPDLPIFLLLNNNSNIRFFENQSRKLSTIDRIFVWNGDSKIFFTMVKYAEDKMNAENDTKIGNVKVILLVEDSAEYYSRYLPVLYSIIFEQTEKLIADVNNNEFNKIARMRARTKVLLASNYEEAIDYFSRYKDYVLCVISDVKFKKNNELYDKAGIELLKHIKNEINDLPTILQSSDAEYSKDAYKLNSIFINKDSETLLQDLKDFIIYYLGFGNFVYRDRLGRQIAVAKSLKEFETHLRTIPDESLIKHASKNHFSLWLMARGEIQVAKIINPVKVSDFNTTNELREYILNVISKYRQDKDKGKVINFDKSITFDGKNIISFASGTLGGKGRGLAFINNLVNNVDFHNIISDINIKTPKTIIIGTSEFEDFINKNNLNKYIYTEKNYNNLKKTFLKLQLSYNLTKRLKILLKLIKKPLAIRSSSQFEDSMMHPFAGIFSTFMLPNNNPDFNIRLQQTMDAIRLVFASIYSDTSRNYFKAVNYKIEEEKMAVIIQEVVGNQFNGCFYPHFSGVAQSYNYYPVANMKPEEGFTVTAVGLGRYVVQGEKAYRFSPKYPKVEINSIKDLYKSSQVYLYAVDMNKKDINLLEKGEEAALIKMDISEAEKHGTLDHCASVYNVENDVISPGLTSNGPRIINFADILKYDYIPLSKTINTILDVVEEAMGTPVEIEFAVDLNKDKNYNASFYLLQIKSLIGSDNDYNINIDKINKKNTLLYSQKSMGNGKIDDINDIIFLDNDKFDKTKTLEMTYEIEKLNAEMISKNKKYVLIGPGRWGTRDRFIGIPVTWPQISNAKVIVEMSLKDFPLDASLGSHFFHNLTSMNICYFSINSLSVDNYINFDILNKQKLINRTKYFKHIRFNKPLTIKIDGKKRISVITVN
jgi:DNA-binding NarL/FixJ family response regulator